MYNNLPLASQRKGLLLDANLLTALLVGSLGAGEVERFKRTRQFTTKDVVELNNIVKSFGWICTTPHVVAEVSNLLDWLDDTRKSEASRRLAAYVHNAKEVHIKAAEIVRTKIYCKLGITDAGLAMLAQQEDCTVFTADLPLYQYASNLGIEIVNFNHIRNQWL
jgi:predicted nucleic acid-binding protein